MKIFNWVHRRFNNTKARNIDNKNGDDGVVETNNVNVFERWSIGLLAIGTFGYDPVKSNACLYDECQSDDQDGSEEEEEDVVNPFVYGMEDDFELEYVMMKKKERTTLADLFSADCEDVQNEDKIKIMIKERANCKNISNKKFLVVKEARPIHKLNRMMRRMLKRKIHPHLATKSNDSASLL